MRMAWGAVTAGLTLLAVAGCTDSRTTEVKSRRNLSPDSSIAADEANAYGEYARPSVTGTAPSFLAQVVAGYWFSGTRGSIEVAVSGTKNINQPLPFSPGYWLVSQSATAVLVERTWNQTVSADCGVTFRGYAQFQAVLEFGGSIVSDLRPFIPVSAAGPACHAPNVANFAWVDFQQYALSSTTYSEDSYVTVSGNASAGSGTLTDQWWTHDGVDIGHGSTTSLTIADGTHTLSFHATNSLGLQTAEDFTYTGVCADGQLLPPDPSDPFYVPDPAGPGCAGPNSTGGGGGGGGPPPNCTVEYVYLEINYNDGTGWHILWEGYATVCG